MLQAIKRIISVPHPWSGLCDVHARPWRGEFGVGHLTFENSTPAWFADNNTFVNLMKYWRRQYQVNPTLPSTAADCTQKWSRLKNVISWKLINLPLGGRCLVESLMATLVGGSTHLPGSTCAGKFQTNIVNRLADRTSRWQIPSFAHQQTKYTREGPSKDTVRILRKRFSVH